MAPEGSAAKRIVYIASENSEFDIPILWQQFESHRELESIVMKIRNTVSEENTQLFDAWCRYFGFKLKSIEIETRNPLENILDPKSFDNLTSFRAVHEFNSPVSQSFLSCLSKFSPLLEKLSIRCETEALPAISAFSRLKHLNISLLVPWHMNPDQLDQWTEQNVAHVLPSSFNGIADHLESFTIYARRISIPWSQMKLSNLKELSIDTGLFRQLLCLTHAHKLQKLTYSYYGTEFCVSEIDDWEVLMEQILKLSVVRLRISNHFKDRIDIINWIATFVEDWPNTMFHIDDYWGDDLVRDRVRDKSDEVTIYNTRSRVAATGSSILIVRMENLLVKVPLRDEKYFPKFKKTTSWFSTAADLKP